MCKMKLLLKQVDTLVCGTVMMIFIAGEEVREEKKSLTICRNLSLCNFCVSTKMPVGRFDDCVILHSFITFAKQPLMLDCEKFLNKIAEMYVHTECLASGRPMLFE